jgi:hypothetical protein
VEFGKIFVNEKKDLRGVGKNLKIRHINAPKTWKIFRRYSYENDPRDLGMN